MPILFIQLYLNLLFNITERYVILLISLFCPEHINVLNKTNLLEQ